MAECKDCIHFCVCSPYTAPNESYPEVDGCKCFRATADVVPMSEVDDLKRYIILNEDIAIKCKQENGEQNEEYWKGKISAFRQTLAYIDAELKKKYTEQKNG